MMQAINKHSLENGSDTPDFILRVNLVIIVGGLKIILN